MQENKTLSRAEWLDKIFGTPVFAVLLAIFCNVLWGSAFPFIKLGYRLFSIETSSTLPSRTRKLPSMNRTPAKQKMDAVLLVSMENSR